MSLGEKIRERVLLLRRFLYHLEWAWPNEVKERINREVFNGLLPIDKPINLEEF